MKDKMKALPRGLYKRGDVYYCRIADSNGRLLRKRLSSDKATAITILGEMRKIIELQRAGLLPDSYTEKIKDMKTLWRRFIEYQKAGQRSCATIEAYEAAYRQICLSNNLKFVADVTLEAVNKWSERRLLENMRGQTVNIYVSIIRSALAWGLNNDLIFQNPLVNWRPVRTNEPRKRRDLTPEEVSAILKAESNTEWRLLWLIYFYTGLRKEAGAAFSWEWINWQLGTMDLPVENNKSRRQHSIPLHPELITALRERHKETGSKAEGRVFPALTPHSINPRFKKLCTKAGLDIDGVTLHSVRHTVATMLYESTGCNLKAVQEILGHANATTTMRYLHLTDQLKREAIGGLDYHTGSEQRRPKYIRFPAAASGKVSTDDAGA